MTINFNVSPYHDDFDETKSFYKILFKKGVAVQSRELNQLQEILQNQIARFGHHVFKDGSMVIPGHVNIDKNVNYIKLLSTYASDSIDVTTFLGREIIGSNNGVRAKVIAFAKADDVDPPTIFVKYLDSGTSGNYPTYLVNETIQTNDANTDVFATVVSSGATGKCIGVSISDGVYFIKDRFVRVAANTIVLDKYLSNSSYRVGLNVVESIIDSFDDESLLDPAVGTSNYFAPGADRYVIELVLSKRTLTDNTSSDTFIELARVVDGDVVDITNKPGYNILRDELARRTYDESGDYTVRPFKFKFIEHLKTDENVDGFLTSADGGDDDLGIAVIGSGKAYVKGYEVETISNRYLTFNKPRQYSNVASSTIRTPIGNYTEVANVYGIPNFTSNLITVELYNNYTGTKGSPNGTLVGNAKIRGIETISSNVMLNSSNFYVYLFDVSMISGYTFERDAKQLYHANVSDSGYSSPAFTADIVSNGIAQEGSVTLVNGSNTVIGVNTLFNTTLKVNDYIKFSSDSGNSYKITAITNATSLRIHRTYPLANVAGVNFTRDEAVLSEKQSSSYLFKMPNDVIKSVTDVSIKTRKVFYGTLSAGIIALNTAAGTTFASRTDADYYAIVGSGANIGKLIRIQSANFSFTDAPTNRNISIDLSGYGLTNEDILVYATITKTNLSAKTKTKTSTSLELTSRTDCISPIISLNVADVINISNVRVSANVFGTAYSESNSIDITDNYILDSGQTPTHYGVSKLRLKTGATIPNGPIKIYYDYFTHGSGDYFSVESYPTYDEIPVFKDQGYSYQLRDYIDFRPRISNDGLNFKNTGAVRNDFLDHANDFECDYQYYLPRIDKVVVTSEGKVAYIEGISSLTPIEPNAPIDSMTLYVIKHPAYGFDLNRDSTFASVDQKRYTMKDIGKLENRIKNLEYYTSLSLLELDTAIFSIKDKFGLDRYKNGFLVDSFKGHSIGDIRNPDYKISMDFERGLLKPSFYQENIQVAEVNSSSSQRTANGYTIVNDEVLMLEYEDVEFINIPVASEDISITPFDVYSYAGVMTLSPSNDTWFEETTLPLIYVNSDGSYDSMIPDSVGEKIYGSVWGSWKLALPQLKVEVFL